MNSMPNFCINFIILIINLPVAIYESKETVNYSHNLLMVQKHYEPGPLKKAKFAHRSKITASITYLAVEGKGGRVKSVLTLRGADISHQHTKKNM